MSQYSEMMGSFIRTGNYPMEANYVFPNEEELKKFYENPINATTLHKGLFRIVENKDGEQALYWVIQDKGESLKFVKLIDRIDIDKLGEQLETLSKELEQEEEERALSDLEIWGTDDPSHINDKYGNISKLADALQELIRNVSEKYEELVDVDNALTRQVKALAGTDNRNIVEYLKTLSYSSLTEVSETLDKFLNTVDASDDKINTLPELQKFLSGYTDKQTLYQTLINLKNEIYGTPMPTDTFRTLRKIEDFVRVLQSTLKAKDTNLWKEINQTQVGVGLNGDGSFSPDKETNFLKGATSIMNALKILDGLVKKALEGITITVENKDIVDLSVRQEANKYVIGAVLRLSNALNNHLLKKEDGLYFNLKTTYEDGVLSVYANDTLLEKHILGLSSIVESAIYDAPSESIIITFKLLNGEKQVINIPVAGLIQELGVDNNGPGNVVVLTRTRVVNGEDKLSADVRINNDKHNILKKVDNTLSVDGTSESITHNDTKLSVVLDEIKKNADTKHEELTNKINEEAQRAGAQETTLDKAIDALEEKQESDIHKLEVKDQELKDAIQDEVTRSENEEKIIKHSIEDLKAADATLTTNVNKLEAAIATEKERAETKETALDEALKKKVETVKIVKNDTTDLSYTLLVDGKNAGEVGLTKDFLKAYMTRGEITQLLALKANLVDGKIPLTELPVGYWIEVQ